MSALDSLPQTQSMLSPTQFMFKANRMPSTVFFCQRVSFPSLSGTVSTTANPFLRLPYGYDHLDFGSFNINFKVDENLQNYQEIFNWMVGIGFPNNYEEYAMINSQSKVSGNWVMSDASTIVLNAENIPVTSIIYKNIMPISLQMSDFDTTNTDINYITATAQFVCESFKIISIV